MEAKELLRVLHTAERLKDETRHCYTSGGRRESVAEHSWRLALTALFLRDEFPALDMDRVIRMCLIHDLGECFTGDIPSFLKSGGDEERERRRCQRRITQPAKVPHRKRPSPFARNRRIAYAGIWKRCFSSASETFFACASARSRGCRSVITESIPH